MKDIIRKSKEYLNAGAVPLAKKAVNKLCHLDFFRYQMYLKDDCDTGALAGEADNLPLISIVVPVYRTKPAYLRELIRSVAANEYEKWELCLCDGSESEEHSKAIRAVIREFKGLNIRYGCLKKNLGISGNTNKAIDMAKGDWIVFADHDDTFTKNALGAVAAVAADNSLAELIYSDEDKIREFGGPGYDPHFKPDYDPYLLNSVNYISHLTAIKRELLERLGGLNSEYDGAQDYDLILRAVEKAKGIVHIPRVLYHWRSCSGSTARELSEKGYADTAGARALKAHISRCFGEAELMPGFSAGNYRLRFPAEIKKLSVVLWSENNDLLLSRKADELKKELGEEVRIYKSSFKDCLRTARDAEGEAVLFLSEAAFISREDALTLLGYILSGYTDACGATLVDEQGVIICSGQLKGENGYPFDAFCGIPASDPGYMGRALMMRGVSFLPIHCLMIRKELIPDFKKLCTPELLGAKLCRNLSYLGKTISCASFIHVTLKHKGGLCSLYKKNGLMIKGDDDRYYHRAFIKRSPGFIIAARKMRI